MKCKICALQNKTIRAIERAYVGGTPILQISKQYDVPYPSLYAHLQNHLNDKLVKAAETEVSEHGAKLIQEIEKLLERANEIGERNYRKKKDWVALKAINESRSTIALLAQIMTTIANREEAKRADKHEQLLNVSLPIQKLTQMEQDLLFQLNQKMLGLVDEINVGEYVDWEEVTGSEPRDSENSGSEKKSGGREISEESEAKNSLNPSPPLSRRRKPTSKEEEPMRWRDPFPDDKDLLKRARKQGTIAYGRK